MSTAHPFSRLWSIHDDNALVRMVSNAVPIGIMLAIWELLSGSVVPADVLPPVSEVFARFIELGLSAELYANGFATLFRGLTGVLIAMLLGVPLGLLMARNDWIYRNIDPLVSLSYPVPKSALIPLLMVWLGTGHLSRIVLAIIGALLPMLINAHNGAANVADELLWASNSMGVDGHDATMKVVFPSALPNIMTGIRIGMIFSFVIVISSEMIIAQTGLGVLVSQAGQFGHYATVFAIILWITVIVAGLDRIYLQISKRVLSWSEQEVGSV